MRWAMVWVSLGEFRAGGFLHPAKPQSVDALDIDAIREQHVKVDIQVQPTRDRFLPSANRNLGVACVAKVLDQGHGDGAQAGAWVFPGA